MLFGPTILGLGAETIGGALGGALAGGLMNEDDPLMGAALGGLSGGVGGPSLAGGLESALGATGITTGPTLGADAVAEAAGAAGSAGTAAGSALSAASTAAPGAASLDAALAGAPDLGGALAAGTDVTSTGLGSVGGTGSIPSPVEQPDFLDRLFSGDMFGGGGGTVDLAGPGAAGTAAGKTVGTAAPTGGFGLKDLATPLAAVGLSMAGSQPSSIPGEDALRAQANSLQAQSNQLRSGQLPPSVQAGLRSASEAAKASLRSMFASKGMSGSSSEIAALADVDQTTAFQGGQLAQRMIETGINEAQLSTQLYTVLMQQALERDQQLGNAIGSFATALAGGNPLARAA
jgi:hypothetical protein